jgi:23S rRNA pseudouridine2605 synthase
MARRPDNPNADEPAAVRLQKFLAEVGVASRRVAEELIEEGRVKVDGRVVRDLPVFIDPASDIVEIDGRRIMNAPERHLYVMLHKPRRCVSTVLDPEGRRTVADLVNHPSKARLYPVGRLDFDTSGLLLMTNDGELTNRLTHPRYGVHKTYRATVKGELEPEAVAELERGIYLAERKSGQTLGGKKTMPVRMSIAARDRDRTVLELTLQEGRNRQVRRMLARVGCPVKKLVRTRMGPLKLKGLAVGEWRELTRTELGALRKEAGLAGASRRGRPEATGAAGKRKPR